MVKHLIKKWTAALLMGISVLGTGEIFPVQASGTGYVNLGSVLQSSTAFRDAGKSLADEQSRLEKQFDKQSQGMGTAEKGVLQKKLNTELMQKQNSLFQPVQQKLKEAVKQAADAKKIDFVISGESVLYGGVDLTSDVQSIMKK